MAWGPAGEYKRIETPITLERLRHHVEDAQWEPLTEFLSMVKEGDELFEVQEGDNHRSARYYLGKRGTQIKYTCVVSVMIA